MFFDTHCHLNFKAFEGRVEEVIKAAKDNGVNNIIVPGTDLETSKKAVEIAKNYSPEPFDFAQDKLRRGIYAAVGIHPHHVYQYQKSKIKDQKYILNIKNDLGEIEKLLNNHKIVAVGEIGIDKHSYQKTKYKDYQVDPELVKGQKEFLKEQIKLAIKYDKSLILHNREAKKDTLEVLNEVWDKKLEGKTVFHCCEPDEELLEFAKRQKMFIGVDGDVTYRIEKQEFIRKVPLEMLVLETDSPYLSPLRKFPNEPKNIKVIAEFIAKLKNVSLKEVEEKTTNNARILFGISRE